MRRRRIGKVRPRQAKVFGGALTQRALAVPHNKLPEPVGRGQAERSQPLRAELARIGQPACGAAAGSNNPDQAASLPQRQQSRRGGLNQAVVVERAVGA
jgi:hypothetical protein